MRIAPIFGLFVSCCVLSSSAALLIQEDFSYPDGNIVTNSAGLWTRHSGSSDNSLVAEGRYVISEDRQDDVSREFGEPNQDAMLYASFVVNVTKLPSTSGTYFAHFKDETSSNFVARVFALRRGAELPGTYRLGIANLSGNATNIFPLDLVTNVDYHVVVSYDAANSVSTLQVNPGQSGDASVMASDVVSGAPAIATWSRYALRQSGNVGELTVDALRVGNSFAEVYTNAPRQPSFAVQPVSATNYAGSSIQLYAVAHGSGALSYQWKRNGTSISDSATVSGANSPVLTLNNLGVGETGSYELAVTSAYGEATSSAAFVSVDTSAIPPHITKQPTGATNSVGSPVTLSVEATGPGPFTYQWHFNDAPVSGATSNRIHFANVALENQGRYYVAVGNQYGTTNSAIAYVSVLPPLRTNIAYLHTLLNTDTWQPTNTSLLFEIEGVITTHTNVTTSGNALYYVQDDTGGIALFYGGSTDFRPSAGDRVRVVGPLGNFNNLLELNLSVSNPLHKIDVLSSGNPLPAPLTFNFADTNDVRKMEQFYEGARVTVYNVEFPAANGVATFAPNRNYTMLNAQGQGFTLRLDSRVTSLSDVVIPQRAYSVTGVMGQFNATYQLMVTRPEEIVLTAPPAPAPALAIEQSVQGVTVTWTATPGASYSIQATDNLLQGFQTISQGLSFSGAEGSFTDTNSATMRFYRVTTP